MVISENNDKKPEKKERPSTKVIIRRLPPTIDQETFLNQVSPVPDYNYIYLVKGDLSLGENAFARAYINFVHPEDVYSFKDRFDNYVFLDNRTGHEYPAVVEFAPFQKIPKKRGKRVDPKCGSIESDPLYLEFIETLNKPSEQDEKPEYSLQLNTEDKSDKKDLTTPLLEYIKNKRAQKLRIREMRREERERKRREFENRKKDYSRSYDNRKYDEKSQGKGPRTKLVVGKSEEKIVTESGDNKPKAEQKIENNNPAPPSSKLDSNSNPTKPKSFDNKPSSGGFANKNRDRKYDDKDKSFTKKDIKPRFPKKEYDHDFNSTKRNTESYNTSKKSYDDNARNKNKDEAKSPYNQKKVKKYSEKREERKIEVQKAEQKKLEEATKEPSEEKPVKDVTNKKAKDETTGDKNSTEDVNKKKAETKSSTETTEKEKVSKSASTEELKDSEENGGSKSKESDLRRIRNKDRPTIAIYRPGMLSKRKHNDDESKG